MLFVESVGAFSSCNENLTMSQFLFSLYLMCTKPSVHVAHKTQRPCGSGEKASNTGEANAKIGRSDTHAALPCQKIHRLSKVKELNFNLRQVH